MIILQMDLYREKRKLDTRERVRRCRARQAAERAAANDEEQRVYEEFQCQASTAECVSLDKYGRQSQRFSASLSRKIALFCAEELKGVDVVIQQDVVVKFLSHPIMQDVIPPFLKNLEAVKHNHAIISNMKMGISAHLSGVRETHLVMAKDILCTLAASDSIQSTRAVAEVLGVDRRNIKRGLNRRQRLDSENLAFWKGAARSIRSDAITEHVRETVVVWWTSQTQVSSNQKDIRRRLRGVKDYESHQTHYLQVSQVWCSLRI